MASSAPRGNIIHTLVLITSSEKTAATVEPKSLEDPEALAWDVIMAASAVAVIPSVIFFIAHPEEDRRRTTPPWST